MLNMTAREHAAAIKKRDIGVEELTSAYLERIDKYDGPEGLNSIAELNEKVIIEARKMDSASSNRDSAMFGLPVLIKDNIDVAAMHTTAGSLALADNIADKDAHIIMNLQRNGALILGKTNMTEFANYTTENMPGGYSSRGGQVINAYNREKTPSGSSSGSAVAMSASFCSAAIGTDTSFSIVGCVTENGVTGLKPAHGSLSSDGIIPIAKTLDSAGPITRDLADAVLVYSCMRDEPLQPIEAIPEKQLKLAVNNFNRDMISEKQLSQYQKVLERLSEAKVEITEVKHEHIKYQQDIMRCEFSHDLEEYLAGSNAKRKTLIDIVSYYENNPEQMMKYGNKHLRDALELALGKKDDPVYIEAMAYRKSLRAELLERLSVFDACLMTGSTNIMHFTGLPSLAIRMCYDADNNTTRGMILYGADERRLIAAALTIEKYCSELPMPQLG